MKQLLRRNRIGVFFAALLLVGAIIGALVSERDGRGRQGPLLSSWDADSGGALALALWLQQLGYRVDRLQEAGALPDDTVALYFVLQPISPFSRADARATLDWVRRGGVLVILQSPFAGDPLADGLGFAERFDARRVSAPCQGRPACVDPAVRPSLAFFSHPSAHRFAATEIGDLVLQDDRWVPLVIQKRDGATVTLAATRRLGGGRVYALADPSFVSNDGLGRADNAALIANILARSFRGKTAAFDEVHHGFTAPPNLLAAARDAPWGWALAYAALVSFLFVVWGGRRFGPAVEGEPVSGRSGGDYVTAFAGLLQRQRGGAAWAQQQLARLLRGRLARQHGLPPDLDAGELARLVAERRAGDPAALAASLRTLEGRPLHERALLRQIQELDRILGEKR